jgi:predicted Zn finger-like uncharacterized protein
LRAARIRLDEDPHDMKIVCEACQAKYSISDDKVRGKVFKIRCKKCSHVIVVRGTDEAALASVGAAPAAAPAEAPAWHVVINGEQVGPLDEADVRGRLERGEISGDTFIWKEGMGDWVKASSVAELAGSADGANGMRASVSSASDDLFNVPPVDHRDSGEAVEPDPFAAAPTTISPAAGAQDLFGAPTGYAASPGTAADEARPASRTGRSFTPVEAPAADGGGFARASAGNGSPSVGGGPVVSNLTGQRHENSVLFSLSNLEALAKPAPAPAAKPAAVSSSVNTEGSGLIDIRAMAASTLGRGAGEGGGASGMPDLPTFGAPQFSPVAPVLLPISQPSGTPKWVYALLAGLGLVAVAVAFMMVKVLKGPEPAPATVAQQQASPPAAAAPAAAPAAPGAAAPAVAAKPGTPPETPPPAKEEALPPRETPRAPAAAAPERGARATGRGKRGRGEAAPRAGAVAAAAREEKSPAPAEKPPARGGGSELDDLLGKALSGGGARAAAPAPTARSRAEEEPKAEKSLGVLSRDDIVKGMNGVVPRAKECYKQFKVPGQADVTVKVAKTGKVSDVQVKGKFAGTPTGSCVADAVRSAKFAPNDGTTIPSYPIFLR